MRRRLVPGKRALPTSLVAAAVIGWSILLLALPARSLEQPSPQLEVTGTLAKLDLLAGKGVLMTDLEKPIFFRLDRPELFERLSVGDRVTMQLDDEGRVLKVIETLPAEVHEPPPPAK
jgi:hypothetical protein